MNRVSDGSVSWNGEGSGSCGLPSLSRKLTTMNGDWASSTSRISGQGDHFFSVMSRLAVRGVAARCGAVRATAPGPHQSRAVGSGMLVAAGLGAFRRPLGAVLGDLLQDDRSRTYRAPQGTPLGHPVEIREPRLAPDLHLHPGVVALAGAGADGQLGVEPVGLHPGVGKGREVLAVTGPALGHLSGREPGVVAWGVFLDRQAGKLLVQWGELARDRGGGAGAEGRDERRRGKKLAMHNVWSAV